MLSRYSAITNRDDAAAMVIESIESGEATIEEFDLDAMLDEMYESIDSWDFRWIENDLFWDIVAKHALDQEDSK